MGISVPVEFPGAAESSRSMKELAETVKIFRERVNETAFTAKEYGVRLNDLAHAESAFAEATKKQAEELKRLVPSTKEASGGLVSLREQAKASQDALDRHTRGTKEYDAAALKLAQDVKALRAEESARAEDMSKHASGPAKSLSGSDMAKAVFSDDLVRRVENLGGVALESSSKLSGMQLAGIGLAGTLTALVAVGIEANDAIEAHKQAVAAALAETTKFADRQEFTRKAMDGSAQAARELGVNVSDTATRQEIQTAVLQNQSQAYILLGRSIDEAIKKAAEQKKQQEQSSEGTKAIGLGIVKAAVGPIANVVSLAGEGLGKLKTLSAEYRAEEEQKAQAAAYAQLHIWEIEVAQTTEQLKQLAIARDKQAVDNQVLLQRLQDIGVQSALGETVLSTGEQIAALDAKINAERERRGELLAEEARANAAFATEVQTGFAMEARFTGLQAEFQKDEVARQTQLNAVKAQTNALEAQRAELIVRQEREKDQTLQLKLQTDQLEYQIAQKGVVIDLGGQSLSQQDRVALVQARINELTDHGRKTWSELPAEIQKSVLALGGMLNTELDAVKQQQDQAKAQRDQARAKGEQAAQAEKQRRSAQLELQIANEIDIAHNRVHNTSISRLDIAQKIQTTEAALLALDLNGERVSQRKLDKAKELDTQLDKLKAAQNEINAIALQGLDLEKVFGAQVFGANLANIQGELVAESKLADLRRAKAFERAEQLASAMEAQRSGSRLSLAENDALLNRAKIIDDVTREQVRNNNELALASEELANAKTQAEELAALTRLNDLGKTSAQILQLKDAFSEVADTTARAEFDKVNKDLEKLVKTGEGMERFGAVVRLGLRTAFGQENAQLADQSSGLITNALGGIETGFKATVQAIIDGKDIGAVLAEQGKVILTNLALEASWKSAMAFATGLFQVATYQYPQAASSFAAGAAFAGVAALGGIAAAAIPSASSSPTNASSRTSSTGSSRTPSVGGGSSSESGNVTYVFNYDGTNFATGGEIREFFYQATRDMALNRGVPSELRDAA